MKYFFSMCLVLSITFCYGQNISEYIKMKLDDNSGQIYLIDNRTNDNITSKYNLNTMELDIYDQRGDYVGSLVLNDFRLPKNEIESGEKVKISKMILKNINSGELHNLANLEFSK